MNFMLRTIVLLSPLLFCIACNRYDRRTYEVVVVNQTAQPLTIGLTKNGPPFERDWAAPEDVAVLNHRDSEAAWGLRLEAGKTASSKRVDAKFEPQTLAILRVYVGDLTMDEILAASLNSPSRRDIRLRQGKNVVTVTETRGAVRVDVKRVSVGDASGPADSPTDPPTSTDD